jgi:hypothetical protein
MKPQDIRKSSTLGVWTAILCTPLAGCHVFGLVPDMRTPADLAHELEPRCRGFTAESAAPFVAPSAVDSVEPAYSYVKSGPNDHEARLRGARIHVRPLPGASRESLARTLECHEARVTLGQEQAATDDPYVLPGRWIDIDVDSEGDGFAVNARVDEFDDARQVLDRAHRFIGNR